MELATTTTHNADVVGDGTSPNSNFTGGNITNITNNNSYCITVIQNRQGGGVERENKDPKEKEDKTAATITTTATTFNGNKGEFCV